MLACESVREAPVAFRPMPSATSPMPPIPDAALIALIGAVLAGGAVVPFVLRRRRRERDARDKAHRAERAGLHEPASLHPVIDPMLCLGCGACTAVCPEGDVLALVGGQAATIAPARCVGHGRCERACPTGAITLVFGTESRGVELPRVQGDYQTNVPGLYIVGELGGMGLVRNAFEQGKQAAEGIARALADDPPAPDAVDVAVVGAGPGGIAAASTLLRAGVDVAVLEREADLGGTVRHYPRRKLVLTQPFEIPGYGTIEASEIPKERLMDVWTDVADETGVRGRIRTGHRVLGACRDADGLFAVEVEGREPVRARRVVLAIGRRGTPRKLGVPGEDQPHVAYGLLEPEAYAGRRCLVVGGGDSAVEAALALSDLPGTEVRLSYRRAQITRAKAANLQRLDAALASGAITVLWETNVTAIHADTATLSSPDGETTVPAEDVFVFAGGELPTALLEACGVEMDTHFGTPRPLRA